MRKTGARNNPVDWNGLEVGIKPASFKLIIPVIYALKNSNLLHVFLIPFVHFTLVQYSDDTYKISEKNGTPPEKLAELATGLPRGAIAFGNWLTENYCEPVKYTAAEFRNICNNKKSGIYLEIPFKKADCNHIEILDRGIYLKLNRSFYRQGDKIVKTVYFWELKF